MAQSNNKIAPHQRFHLQILWQRLLYQVVFIERKDCTQLLFYGELNFETIFAQIQDQVGDGVHPKISPTISFSGMYQKPFIYCRNRTNSQKRAQIYSSV